MTAFHRRRFLSSSRLLSEEEENTWDMVMATAVLDCYNNHHVNTNSQSKKPNTLGSIQQNAVMADSKQLIGDALHRRVEAVDHEVCNPGDEDTFFVADLGEVYRQHLRWKKNLPRVKPFYGGCP